MRRSPIAGLFLAFMVGWSATGCVVTGQSVTTTPQPIPPTEIATSTLVTPAPTVARPTPWSVPTGTPEPAPTTRVATAEPPATAEPDIAATLIAGTTPRLYASYASPDGRQRAEVHIFDCAPFPDGDEYAYDRLQIVDTATGAARFIDGQLQACGGLGAFGLGGLFWSPLGRFFYYTDAREGIPDGCGYWSRPISRVDATDGTAANLGGGPLSPDGMRLAVWVERDLVIYDVDGREIGRAAAADPTAALGPISWSPDSRALVYLQAGMFCIPGESGLTTVARVDLPEMASSVLVRSADPAFQDVAWVEPEALLLGDDVGGQWQLDAAGGEPVTVP